MYDTVIAALRRGAADEALALARELVDTRPDDTVAQRLLANAQRMAGDDAAALATLDAALDRAPDDADLHLERASLLLRSRKVDEAEAALARSVGLDPNQFPAYIIQAQLALGRGELEESERLVRTAARIAPEHPQVAAIEGMLALRRGQADAALALLSQASARAPDEPTLLQALGFAHLAKGHLAFAEQAFRGVLGGVSGNAPQRALIAELVNAQGRPGDAADELVPLLDDPATTPGMHRLVGALELRAGRDTAIARLKHALALMPGDRRTLTALIHAWQALEERDDARSTLDAALATHPGLPDLWLARLAVEPFAGDEARAVIDRWVLAMPDHIPALEARMAVHDAQGEAQGAEAAAQRIVELEPGHARAEMRLLDGLVERDPQAAIERVRTLLARAEDPDIQRGLRQLLGMVLDKAGQAPEAVATWLALHGEAAHLRMDLPAATGFQGPWPDLHPLGETPTSMLLIWGAPGSGVERVVQTFRLAGAPVLTDRFGEAAPNDPLQRFDTGRRLVEGSLDGAYLAAQWRAGLAVRGVQSGSAFDWIPAWDNALLLALRPHLPEVMLMFVLRDPRDMLLDWLAFGSPVPLKLENPVAAARWLADALQQVADIVEQELTPYRLLRLDGAESDSEAVAQQITDALQIEMPIPPAQALGPARLPSGHWRRFSDPLGEAFAELAPVAARLGYGD